MIEWISINDEKPKPKQPIIIFTISLIDKKTNRIRIGRLKRDYSFWGYSEHFEKQFEANYYVDLINEKVTHWIPLPDFPEVENAPTD